MTSMKRVVGAGLRVALFGAALAASLHARPDAEAQPRQGGMRQPPPAAFEACSGRQQGDACSIAFAGQHIEGTCAQLPDRPLVCRPSRMPPGGPPPR